MTKLHHMLRRLFDFAPLLLRFCLGAQRVHHLIRILWSAEALDVSAGVESDLRSTLEHVMRTEVSDAVWLHSSFPLRLGGLGVYNPVKFHAPAFVSSSVACFFGDTVVQPCPNPRRQNSRRRRATRTRSLVILSFTVRQCGQIRSHTPARKTCQRRNRIPNFLGQTWCTRNKWTLCLNTSPCETDCAYSVNVSTISPHGWRPLPIPHCAKASGPWSSTSPPFPPGNSGFTL